MDFFLKKMGSHWKVLSRSEMWSDLCLEVCEDRHWGVRVGGATGVSGRPARAEGEVEPGQWEQWPDLGKRRRRRGRWAGWGIEEKDGNGHWLWPVHPAESAAHYWDEKDQRSCSLEVSGQEFDFEHDKFEMPIRHPITCRRGS